MLPQVIFVNDSSRPGQGEGIRAGETKPVSVSVAYSPGSVELGHGLFRERRELVKRYVLGLATDKVLQNHQLEAGIRIDRPCTELHQGWEDPHCQLRGHFAGHWLSSLAWFAAADRDTQVQARLGEAVRTLQDCQKRNGGGWAGSIPEKYFTFMEKGIPLWSPQYTVHKSLQGLLDASRSGTPEAREVLDAWADWFYRWGLHLLEEQRIDVVYQGECAGMLELWADLFDASGNEKYLKLAGWYSSPDMFQRLLDGQDPLSNNHANASIPWIQGAARLYEVTGDSRMRQIVEAFWNKAVLTRGMFATTGNNAGEFWVPEQGYERFLGERTQEHCTVYNMIRVAASLLHWTGESRYASYIERALYNGILAQQNGFTGMVSYFLPLSPGSKKKWGTETKDFWCCHGTLVQAPALYESLIYHKTSDGITLDQYIPSTLDAGNGTRLRLEALASPDRINSSLQFRLDVESDGTEWTLRIRLPEWLSAPARITLDGQTVDAAADASGYLVLRRSWTKSTLTLAFPKTLRKEFLPGSTTRFALVDGPLVLAGLCDREEVLPGHLAITPLQEHQYVGGREWQTSHWLVGSYNSSIRFKPVHEVTDEVYTVYFRES